MLSAPMEVITLIKTIRSDWLLFLFLLVILILVFYPLAQMVIISLKTPGQFYFDPIRVTPPLHFENWLSILPMVGRPIANSAFLAGTSIVGTLFVASLSAYAFACLDFPAKEGLFYMIISLLMIPGLLTLVPRFVVIARSGLIGTYFSCILPYIAGGQIFSIFVLRTFFSGVSRQIAEAARVDGASDFGIYWRIVLPLSKPILATLAVMQLLSIWNDFIWPLVTVGAKDHLRTLTVQLFYLNTQFSQDWGLIMSGYVIGSIPLILMFSLASKVFIRGLSSGAIKM